MEPAAELRRQATVGLALAVIGPPLERLLRTIYDRDESFQLLLTFALVLMLEDVMRFVWGTAPVQLRGVYLVYGQVTVAGSTVPVYNLLVIAAGGAHALLRWLHPWAPLAAAVPAAPARCSPPRASAGLSGRSSRGRSPTRPAGEPLRPRSPSSRSCWRPSSGSSSPWPHGRS